MEFTEKRVYNDKKVGQLHQGDCFIDEPYYFMATNERRNDGVLVVCLDDGETMVMSPERVVEQITIDEIIFHRGEK